ncbi:MAG TPA: 3-hydroxybutyrate dehydrogenase [Steroidobacteraceae bacterium]|nr:3-hydroxybutyrate dehydrogenase [Steroidobacteraceae bacterium]
MRLKDQVAVITGAGSGIGLEIARTFSREGAQVAVADLDAEAAAKAAAELHRGGGEALALAMDVTREDEVDSGMARVVQAFGRIDILVCNAGIQIISALEALSLEEWHRVLAVHLDGAFLTTRAALKDMYARRRGSIIYMGSVHSKEASVLKAPYVTAKHGLIGLAKTVAKEGAKRGVRANVICPGFVRTPLVERQIPEQAKALGISEEAVIREVMLKETVDREFTTTRDVAEAALFLASFESAALTGQSLIVSHGWHMQ